MQSHASRAKGVDCEKIRKKSLIDFMSLPLQKGGALFAKPSSNIKGRYDQIFVKSALGLLFQRLNRVELGDKFANHANLKAKVAKLR